MPIYYIIGLNLAYFDLLLIYVAKTYKSVLFCLKIAFLNVGNLDKLLFLPIFTPILDF
jgi:hypothetical protein